MNEPDVLLAHLAASQAGVFTSAHARSAGFTDPTIAARLRDGLWCEMHRDVFRIAGSPVTWDAEVLAASYFFAGRAVASRRTAARLHRLDGFAADPTVEFTAVRARRSLNSSVTLHTAVRLDAIDHLVISHRLEHAGARPVVRIPATTASRTILDLARLLPAEPLGNAIDSAVRLGLTSPTYLGKRLRVLRGRGRHGVRLIDMLMLDSGGHTWLERRFLRLVREAGLPRPRCQVVFAKNGRTIARVDFQFEGTTVIVEVSGRRGHVSEADRLIDARRRNELQHAGFTVVEFVTSQVLHDPAYVLRTLQDAFCSSVSQPPASSRPSTRPKAGHRRGAEQAQ